MYHDATDYIDFSIIVNSGDIVALILETIYVIRIKTLV